MNSSSYQNLAAQLASSPLKDALRHYRMRCPSECTGSAKQTVQQKVRRAMTGCCRTLLNSQDHVLQLDHAWLLLSGSSAGCGPSCCRCCPDPRSPSPRMMPGWTARCPCLATRISYYSPALLPPPAKDKFWNDVSEGVEDLSPLNPQLSIYSPLAPKLKDSKIPLQGSSPYLEIPRTCSCVGSSQIN